MNIKKIAKRKKKLITKRAIKYEQSQQSQCDPFLRKNGFEYFLIRDFHESILLALSLHPGCYDN